MTSTEPTVLSIVVPVFNESEALPRFHKSLITVLEKSPEPYELIYCNDGSTDETSNIITKWSAKNKRIKLIELSRNFGKEIAVTAGIDKATGQATIIIDGDGQHPVELIPKFIKRWRAGSKIVIGLRTDNEKEGVVKRYGSRIFYKLFKRLTGIRLVPGATDYRLIDKAVRQQFVQLTERNRIARGLIDWLGYEPEYISFKARARDRGQASYSFGKLSKLAVDSIVSMSISPLYVSAYIGAVVLPLSLLLAIFMIINAVVGDPFGLNITGSAYLIVFMLFLVGILLVSQGIIGLYLSHIHAETQNRPLYIIDNEASVNLNET